MGFTIFISSGSFNPSDYGLSPGDMIHVKCVGGGGAGGGAYDANTSYAGSNGGASSFGNILSAAGGRAGPTGSFALPAAQVGSCQGSGAGLSQMPSGSASVKAYYGGCGGHGWLPGVNMPTVAGCALSQVPFNICAVSSSGLSMYTAPYPTGYFTCFGNFAQIRNGSSATGQYAAQTGRFGGYGGCRYANGGYTIGGAGGVGYGAGGGGCGSSVRDMGSGGGGNGGVIADTDYVLTSVSSITVTVGAGGAGRDGSECSGGGGARGCVAIWW